MADTAFHAMAPGRVNLIGEHTDYNGGMVLPAGLSVQLDVTLTPRSDSLVQIMADSFDEPVTRDLNEPAQRHWSDPALGTLIEANALGLLSGGADLSIQSSIPHGAGLSSSAALIVAILKAARSAANSSLSNKDIALAARRVENDYIGVPCGIMDQMAVAVTNAGEAIALDTQTLEYRLVTLPDTHAMVVVHSGHTRNLNEGRYAERKEECDAARAAFGRDDICLLDPVEIEAVQGIDDIVRRRARHCATEHRRVLAAVDAIAAGDMERMGKLMLASHASMRDDFEISIPEIDALVGDAHALGAVGARLTGGGFGGCIVACVETSRLSAWQDALIEAHPKASIVAKIGG